MGALVVHLNKWERKCLDRYSRHEGGGDLAVMSSLATKGLLEVKGDGDGGLIMTVTEAGHRALAEK